MNIYFCGPIGSGKTTIGALVAHELGLPCFDLDHEMELLLGYSFHRLVQEKGWLAFRELEYTICKGFAEQSGIAVCLGGGTVRYPWNVDLLKPTGIFILFEASTPELIRRVAHCDRPRVNHGATLEEDIASIWENERHKYRAVADLIYPTDGKTVEQGMREIRDLILREPRCSALLATIAEPGHLA